MNDQELKRVRIFIAWGVLGLIIVVGVSIVASLAFFGYRSFGTFYPFFPVFFPFHFGLLGDIFLIFILFLVARWIFWSSRMENSGRSSSQYHYDPHNILKERYAKGEITKEQFEQMMRDLEQHS